MNKLVKILLVIVSLFWNYWFSLIVLWLFLATDIIQFKVRVMNAEFFADVNSIILFFVNCILCYIREIGRKKIIALSFVYFVLLHIGLFFMFGFQMRYIALIYACLSVFILNGLCLLIARKIIKHFIK